MHQEGESHVLKESFAGFKEQHREMTGEAVASTLLQKLDEFGLNCENLHGQGYDGSGFMAGIRKGVSSIVSFCNIYSLLQPYTEPVYCQFMFCSACL